MCYAARVSTQRCDPLAPLVSCRANSSSPIRILITSVEQFLKTTRRLGAPPILLMNPRDGQERQGTLCLPGDTTVPRRQYNTPSHSNTNSTVCKKSIPQTGDQKLIQRELFEEAYQPLCHPTIRTIMLNQSVIGAFPLQSCPAQGVISIALNRVPRPAILSAKMLLPTLLCLHFLAHSF